LREHDIVLTFLEGHHELSVALECRDRLRRVGVPDVEAFWAKCQRTGISLGIIVSAKGFTRTAISKANTQNIGCLSLDEVERFDWCQTPGVSVVDHDLVALSVRLTFQHNPGEGSRLVLADGSALNEQIWRNWARQAFHNYIANRNELTGNHTFNFVESNPAIFIEHPGGRIQATELVFSPTYSIDRKSVPFEFRSYFDRAKSRSITTAAVAQIEIEGRPANMVLSRDEKSGLVTVSIVPEAQKTELQQA
jgi:Restriction endonuclease